LGGTSLAHELFMNTYVGRWSSSSSLVVHGYYYIDSFFCTLCVNFALTKSFFSACPKNTIGVGRLT
jgi:hypothetical protein